ncbi:MAG: cation:proton antiporter [Nevskiales bacterium]
MRFVAGYAAVVALGAGLIYALLLLGQHQGAGGAARAINGGSSGWGSSLSALAGNLLQPIPRLLLQIVVVIVVARACGRVFARFGQPAVIGEILAGLLLGPSALGLVAPEAMQFLFPPESLASLKLLSMLGVMLFMFVVGMDLDVQHLRHQARIAVIVSHSSIVLSFTLGVLLALTLYADFAPAGVGFTAFALFMGIAMSITAFPVLARILEEKRLADTALGRQAIACAAVDDVTAWCLLALVIAVVKASGVAPALITILMTLVFLGGMLFVVRPLLERVLAPKLNGDTSGRGLFTALLVLVFGSAWCAEVIGVHAIFGAFLAGVILPAQPALRAVMRERLEAFSSTFLMPLFFAVTGLRTQFDFLGGLTDWLICAGIIAAAMLGKFGGGMLAARAAGMGWREASAIGSLMNTRGLMELVVLNIGYDLGVLSPRIFAMLVLMALVTTFMTGPLIGWLLRPQKTPKQAAAS